MYAIYMFIFSYILWVFFLAVMNLKRARNNGTLSKFAFVLGLPILYVGLLLDFLVNVFIASFLFLDIPRELTVTARLKKHVANDSWRGNVARWIANHLLDDFDPSGKHI